MRYKIRINGECWTYAALSSTAYTRTHGADSAAITDVKNKRIDFMYETATLSNVIHELVHAYKSYLCLEDATMDDSAYEEIYATFFSKFGISLIQTAIKMYTRLNKDSSLEPSLKFLRKVNNQCQK